MRTIDFTDLQDNLGSYFDQISTNGEPMLVTGGGENMVILPQRLYDSITETLYLMSSRANYEHLMRSIKQANLS